MTLDTYRRLLDELEVFFRPILDTEGDPSRVVSLFEEIGWDLTVFVPAGDRQALAGAVDQIIAGVDGIAGFADDAPTDLLAFVLGLTTHVGPVMSGVGRIADALPGGAVPDLDELPADLLNFLVLRYLERRSPVALSLLELVGVVTAEPTVEEPTAGDVYRVKNRCKRVDLTKLGDLVSDPVHLITTKYWPNGFDDEGVGIVLVALRMLAVARALGLLDHLRGAVPWADDAEPGFELPDPGQVTLGRVVHLADGAGVAVGLSLEEVPEAQGGPGAVASPYGTLSISEDIGPFAVRLMGTLAGNPLRITSGGVAQIDPGKPPFEATLTVESGERESPAFTLGDDQGLRLSLERWVAFVTVRAGASTVDVLIGTDLAGLALRIHPGSGDGFIAKLLPPEGIEVSFDLEAGWSSTDGPYFGISGGLDVAIPVHLEIGPVLIETVFVSLRVGDDRRVVMLLTASASATLGPVSASVQRIGLRSTVTFPAGGGNAGPMDVAAAFEPPIGAGLVVDASGLTGGGYLEFDRENERYAGILALDLAETVAVTAIGLITTRLPDGRKTFSMLINLGIVFEPCFELSIGFVLCGVGGLCGINRAMVIEELQKGVRQGTLDSILFPNPDEVIANASKIISDLRTVFPPHEGRFVVGPMVKLGWGSPQVVTAVIGVFISLPDPIAIALLGKVKAAFPEPDEPIVRINLHVLGTLSMEKEELSFQASLYDSEILTFKLFGDSAALLRWGEPPEFTLALGGFHPRFTPPPPPIIFGDLKRLTLTVSWASEIFLMCQAYQALTPNSLQFGARVQLIVNVDPVSANGEFGFDALFYFNPFSFTITADATINITVAGVSLVDADIDLKLSGPTPWNAQGTATVRVLFIDVDGSFNVTWGPGQQEWLDPVDPLDRLVAALEDNHNWSATLPDARGMVEALQPLEPEPGEEATVVVHPAGSLEVRQTVLPLGVVLEKFGNAPISRHDRFELTGFSVRSGPDGADGDAEAPGRFVKEHFARGQFERLNKTARLSKPSFEKMTAGAGFSSDPIVFEGTPERGSAGYESVYLTEEELTQPTANGETIELSWNDTRLLVVGSASSQSRRLTGGRQRFRGANGEAMVTVREERYAIADADEFARADVDDRVGDDRSRWHVEQVLARYVEASPDDSRSLMVVAEYELAEATA